MSKTIPVRGPCKTCRSPRLPSPLISPMSAARIIQAAGDHGQMHMDGWIYFLDDQELEISGAMVPVGDVLAGSCEGGASLWECAPSSGTWKPVTGGES